MRERRKVMTGRVVSDKMALTVIVEVQDRASHPLYGKVITKVRRFKAHNVDPKAKAGDFVKIVEARPLSRSKHFRVAEIIQRGEVLEPIAEVELESLREKERLERESRQVEQERRAAARLRELGGLEPEEEPAEETGAQATPAGEDNTEEAQ